VVAKRLMVPVDSGELDVLVAGREGMRTVATLHPIESMHEALPLLAEVTEARVVCVNPRGVGRSSPHRDVRDATIDGMAADLDQVRQALGFRRWVIWGMSGGSVVAMASGRWHPGGIEALILDSAGPCFASTLADPACVLSPLHANWAGRVPVPTDDDGIGRLDWTAVPDVGWVLRRGGGPALMVSAREPSAQMRQVMSSLLAFDARPWLAAIDVPTLVLAGSADQVAPLAHLRELHGAVPGASLAVIEGAGHVPITDRPDDVTTLVRRFLAQRVWT
jgi:pimeloyl-ACP methyl ester carboxylesterase